jgi:hypothetical protein
LNVESFSKSCRDFTLFQNEKRELIKVGHHAGDGGLASEL